MSKVPGVKRVVYYKTAADSALELQVIKIVAEFCKYQREMLKLFIVMSLVRGPEAIINKLGTN